MQLKVESKSTRHRALLKESQANAHSFVHHTKPGLPCPLLSWVIRNLLIALSTGAHRFGGQGPPVRHGTLAKKQQPPLQPLVDNSLNANRLRPAIKYASGASRVHSHDEFPTLETHELHVRDPVAPGGECSCLRQLAQMMHGTSQPRQLFMGTLQFSVTGGVSTQNEHNLALSKATASTHAGHKDTCLGCQNTKL